MLWSWCVSLLITPAPVQTMDRYQSPPSQRLLGLNTHLATRWQHPQTFPVVADRIAQSGTDWVREDIHWYRVQRTPEAYDWSFYDTAFADLATRQINILAVLGHPPGWATGNPHDDPYENSFAAPDPAQFAAWAAATVARYRHTIHYWQIWNEPDNPTFWYPSPNPRAYAQLVITTAAAIARVAPEVKIVAAGVNPFNPDFLNAAGQAGLWNAIDIIAIHPYVSPHPPAYSGLRDAVLMLTTLMQRYGSRPIWATEVGWSSGVSDRDATGQLTDADQAQFLTQAIPVLWDSGIDAVFWYTFKDERHNPYGLIRWGSDSDDISSVRPAFAAFMHVSTHRTSLPVGQSTPHTVSNFDGQRRYWVRGDEPFGTLDYCRSHTWQGSHALCITYQFPPLGNRYLVFRQRRPLPLPAHTHALRFMLWGDNQTTMLKLWLKGGDGTVVQLALTPSGPATWRSVTVPLPPADAPWERIEGPALTGPTQLIPPITIEAIVLDDTPDGVASAGTIYIDQLQALTTP